MVVASYTSTTNEAMLQTGLVEKSHEQQSMFKGKGRRVFLKLRVVPEALPHLDHALFEDCAGFLSPLLPSATRPFSISPR